MNSERNRKSPHDNAIPLSCSLKSFERKKKMAWLPINSSYRLDPYSCHVFWSLFLCSTVPVPCSPLYLLIEPFSNMVIGQASVQEIVQYYLLLASSFTTPIYQQCFSYFLPSEQLNT